MPIFELGDEIDFPPLHFAIEDGLLAYGGNLSTERLVYAYQNGIFPWYSEPNPILWWSPNPRMVLFPNQLHISHSLKQTLKKHPFQIRLDTDFEQVITYCGTVIRNGQSGTWLTPEMKEAYIKLHRLGYAHSVEVYQNEKLVGGLYGIALGRIFFGESMFALVPNASKVGFTLFVQYLNQKNYELIDCQVYTEYLDSFGAKLIEREDYISLLTKALEHPTDKGKWVMNGKP